jgi:citrate lyase subunit beta/citryl-CoA lyase
VWLRVNSGPRRLEEVRALAGIPTLRGLVLAKTEDAEDVRGVADLLSSLGDEKTLLMPLIESPAAVLDATAIARAPRVHQLQIGEVDLAGELGFEPGDDESELWGIRTMIVLASAAAALHPPVGPVSRLIADTDAFLASTRRVRRQGFMGRACIHPAQVALVHDVFNPTEDEVADAASVVELLRTAEASGTGVVLDGTGRMVDPAVLKNAEMTLALAAKERGW